MIRPFNLRDLALVRRLSEQGVSLHTESTLTNDLHPLRGALLNLVSGDFPTFVWKLEEVAASGFIQLRVEGDERHAQILYVGSDTAVFPDVPEQPEDETIWLTLIDQAVVEIGRRGIHSLVAEVSETGPELPILRRAGFAVYTRQDIFRLETAVAAKLHTTMELQPRRPVDDWDIQLLYGNLVPRLVQLVEPVPLLQQGEGWLLRENDELAAFAHIRAGSTATWMRLFIHPNAETHADDIITAAAKVAIQKANQPIYCCVRRYQSWLQNPMARIGFEQGGSQAVVVKHTVHHTTNPLPELSTTMDRQHVPASAPMIRHFKHKENKD